MDRMSRLTELECRAMLLQAKVDKLEAEILNQKAQIVFDLLRALGAFRDQRPH